MKKPFVISNDDSETVIVISKHKVRLNEAQDFLDGYVELITLRDGSQVLLNEDGRSRSGIKLERNLAATAMLKPEGVRMSAEGIVGNALILQNECRWD